MTEIDIAEKFDTLQRARMLDRLCDAFEECLIAGQRPDIESYLNLQLNLDKNALIAELIAIEVHYRRLRGEQFEIEEYHSRFPALSLASVMETYQQSVQVRHRREGHSRVDTISRERFDATSFLQGVLEPPDRPNCLGKLGHFAVERILGRGAFGMVTKAFDDRLHRIVAIKFLNPELASLSPPRKRFLREARTAAAIRHENIVGIYTVEDSPTPHLVMEYVSGPNLQQWLDQNGPLDPETFLMLSIQLANGIAAAHAVNLIHRDIKPANILLETGDELKTRISDFGLARAVDDASLTSSGLIAGTPMYMSPEQANGSTLDCRSDLFSLGSVMYQMITGRPPFRAATTLAVLKRVCEDEPRPIQEVISETPDWIGDIVRKLMQKNPNDRFQSARELIDLLTRCKSKIQSNENFSIATLRGYPHMQEYVSYHPSRSSVQQRIPDVSAVKQDTVTRFKKWGMRMCIALGILLGLVLMFAQWNRRGNDPSISDPSSAASLGSRANTPRTPETWDMSLMDTSGDLSRTQAWGGWPPDAPPPARSPFSAEQAKQHQIAWAKYLKVDVEYKNSLDMKFQLIPPGEFMMGSSETEVDEAMVHTGSSTQWQTFLRSETPQHKVILSKPIYLSVTEVTQHQYEQVMGNNPSFFSPQGKGKDKINTADTSDHPVEFVNWASTLEFCNKLNRRERLPFVQSKSSSDSFKLLEGMAYRLPTEAEWEFACRAGATTKYWSGDSEDDLKTSEWFDGNHDKQPNRVAELKENPFGLFDMHGNVSEWVHDSWSAGYYEKFQSRAALNPAGATPGNSLKISRGGCFANQASALRSAARYAFDEKSLWTALGFRVAIAANRTRD